MAHRRRYQRRRLRRYRRRRYRRRQLRLHDEQMSQIAGTNLGPDPMWATCPNCDEEVLTTTEKSVLEYFQMLAAFGICALGCICCFYIPFCMDDWKNVLHTCPNCNYAIGRKGGRTFVMRRSLHIH